MVVIIILITCSLFHLLEERPKPCDSQPCHNGATCTNTETSFLCKCPPEFIGKVCDRGTLNSMIVKKFEKLTNALVLTKSLKTVAVMILYSCFFHKRNVQKKDTIVKTVTTSNNDEEQLGNLSKHAADRPA